MVNGSHFAKEVIVIHPTELSFHKKYLQVKDSGCLVLSRGGDRLVVVVRCPDVLPVEATSGSSCAVSPHLFDRTQSRIPSEADSLSLRVCLGGVARP